jgi:hypothetical protein
VKSNWDKKKKEKYDEHCLKSVSSGGRKEKKEKFVWVFFFATFERLRMFLRRGEKMLRWGEVGWNCWGVERDLVKFNCGLMDGS